MILMWISPVRQIARELFRGGRLCHHLYCRGSSLKYHHCHNHNRHHCPHSCHHVQAHPAERGHFRVGGDGGNYDIDTHANIADRSRDDDEATSENPLSWIWKRCLQNDLEKNTRLNAATTLREEAGEALKGCKILVTLCLMLSWQGLWIVVIILY